MSRGSSPAHREAVAGTRGPLARSLWLAGAVLVPLLTTGCQPADSPDGATGQVRLLVAVTATSAEPLPALTQDVVTRLHELGLASEEAGGATVATVVGVDREQLPREPQEHDLTPLRGNKLERIPERRDEKVGEAVASFTASVGSVASDADGLDLLALLDQAGAQDATDIVVVSSGVSTVDPLDLRQLGWNQDVESVVDDLADQDLLPRHLDGTTVTFVGLGSTAGTQSRLAGPEQEWIERLWLSICRRAGAECDLAQEVPSASEPAATRPVPEVTVPTYDTSTGTETRPDGACRSLLRLPSQLLFDGNSAQLRPDADTALDAVVGDVRSGATITEVAGHAADIDDGDGRELSLQRAEAVERRLLELGMDPGRIDKVVGYGEAQEIEPSRNPDGTVNEARAAMNRRVDITTTHIDCAADKNGASNA